MKYKTKPSKILTKEFLYKEYILNKKSLSNIAKIINCNLETIRTYLKKYAIKIRTLSESRLGNANPNYIEGLIREYPIEFNNILKESIRERDEHICQICGKSQLENGKKLDVHHIDYDKYNLNPENLISLCMSCHMKTNPKKNRETYIEFFSILKETLNV